LRGSDAYASSSRVHAWRAGQTSCARGWTRLVARASRAPLRRCRGGLMCASRVRRGRSAPAEWWRRLPTPAGAVLPRRWEAQRWAIASARRGTRGTRRSVGAARLALQGATITGRAQVRFPTRHSTPPLQNDSGECVEPLCLVTGSVFCCSCLATVSEGCADFPAQGRFRFLCLKYTCTREVIPCGGAKVPNGRREMAH
jgi:hypothetical protein